MEPESVHKPLFLHGLDAQKEAVVGAAVVVLVLSVVVVAIVAVVVPAGMMLQNIPL